MKYHIFIHKRFLPELKTKLLPLIPKNRRHNIFYLPQKHEYYGYINLEIQEADAAFLKLQFGDLYVFESTFPLEYYQSQCYTDHQLTRA